VIRSFARFDYSSGFAVLIGVLEGLGGLLALVPGLVFYGSVSIAVVMIGATYTHLSTGIGSPSMALLSLAVAVLLMWLRFRNTYWLKDRFARKPDD
jgi:hypothetical protein